VSLLGSGGAAKFVARIRNSQSKPPVRACQTCGNFMLPRLFETLPRECNINYNERLELGKAELMRKAGEPRATRRLGPKCLIIVQKSIHQFLPVSNGFCAGIPSGRRLSWPATHCKQRTSFCCYHCTRVNRGWHGFSLHGKCGYLFHKDFHKQLSP